MPVYVIRAGASGPVKIGVARDVLNRLKTLQTSHHVKLSVVRVLDGEAALEVALHERFRPQRLAGEWFDLTVEQIEQDMGATDLPLPTISRRRLKTAEPGNFAMQLILALGGRAVVAEATRSDQNTVCHWERRKSIPLRHAMALSNLAKFRGQSDITLKTIAYGWTPNFKPIRPEAPAPPN